MAFNVTEFRSALVGDGARPNLFSVSLVFPTPVADGTTAGQKTTFLCKAAQLPGSQVNTVSLPYFGRELKFAGNRVFNDWTITIINDEDFAIRRSLENWMNLINSHASNVRDTSFASPSSYSIDATVSQYSKTGPSTILKNYSFVGMFPIDLAPIDVAWDSNDTIEDYTVSFAYQYWTSDSTS